MVAETGEELVPRVRSRAESAGGGHQLSRGVARRRALEIGFDDRQRYRAHDDCFTS